VPNILEAPPSPPEIVRRFGGGGGRSRPPWQLWIALALIAVSGVAFSMLVIRAVRWQPIAASLSVAWAVVWLIVTNRRLKAFRINVSDNEQGLRYFAGAITGGMVAVLVQALVAEPTMGVFWLIMSSVGIGGGFGIGAASFVYCWYGVFLLARLLLTWRAA